MNDVVPVSINLLGSSTCDRPSAYVIGGGEHSTLSEMILSSRVSTSTSPVRLPDKAWYASGSSDFEVTTYEARFDRSSTFLWLWPIRQHDEW